MPMGFDGKTRALVTGGTGFIGQSLVRRLVRFGYRVRIVTRSVARHQRLFAGDTYDQRQVEWFEGDISRCDSIKQAFKNVECVFHLAAMVDSIASYKSFELANVEATRNICDLSVTHSVSKLVYLSTSDVFGLPKDSSVINENTPHSCWNEPYPDTKIVATRLVKWYQHRGLTSVILYPGWVYGPGDCAFLPSLFQQIKTGIMPLWSPDAFKISLVYIDDLVDAILLAANATNVDNEDFLILDDQSRVSLGDLCQRVSRYSQIPFRFIRTPYWTVYALGLAFQTIYRLGLIKQPALTTNNVKSFGYDFNFSAQKARARLGWLPKTSMDTGIAASLEWYARNSKLCTRA
jgi:nucleoside-diphosphate-sugar epimerase